jgi:hypothetical protein
MTAPEARPGQPVMSGMWMKLEARVEPSEETPKPLGAEKASQVSRKVPCL